MNINQYLYIGATASIVHVFSFTECIKGNSDFQLTRQKYLYSYIIKPYSTDVFLQTGATASEALVSEVSRGAGEGSLE